MSNFSVSLGTGSAANCDKPNVPRGVVDPSFPIAVIVRTPFSGRPCPAYVIARMIDFRPDVLSATKDPDCGVCCANADDTNAGTQDFPSCESCPTTFGGTG